MLETKLGRDLARLKGQVITIGLVLACGVMSMIMLASTVQSLERSRDEYYRRRIVSISSDDPAPLDDLHLVAGRLPAAGPATRSSSSSSSRPRTGSGRAAGSRRC